MILKVFDISLLSIIGMQTVLILYATYVDMGYKRTMHEVSLDIDVWFEHQQEIEQWIKNNIKMSTFVCKIMGSNYYFLRKSDAVGFKLRWL